MSLVIKKKQYELMSEGLHNVTITRVDDLGPQETMYGTKDKARIVFTALDQKDKAGDAVDAVMSVNKVITSKSSLGILLDKLGIDGSADEFDLNDVVGVKCQVVIEHKENDGRTYANITSVLKNRKSAEV
jgi:hypothetical protein